MIDTFEISFITIYKTIKLIQQELGEELVFKNGTCTITNPLQQPGIQQLRIIKLKNTSSYQVTLTVNPMQLITEKETPILFECTPSNMASLKDKLNDELEYLHPSITLMKRTWRLSRIDYAQQCYTQHHLLYPLLESQGAVPSTDTDYGFEGSTYRSNKSTKLNAYSKQLQVESSNHSHQYKDVTKRLYRFEKQCHKPSTLCKKYELKGSDLFALFDEMIAYKELTACHKRHIKAGDYYSRNQAIEKIYATPGKHEKSNALLVEVLDCIVSEGTLNNALTAIQEGSENVPERFRAKEDNESYQILKERFKEFIRHHLCKVGINPILLPEDCSTSCVINSYTELFEA
ncbi:hypothetical protein [Lysinibacillus fusiformis]|uniref:hypothetical protein n=1 Tax=Lysinibacillus fusiformis TaxID=28031 RepID=UPI0030169E92